MLTFSQWLLMSELNPPHCIQVSPSGLKFDHSLACPFCSCHTGLLSKSLTEHLCPKLESLHLLLFPLLPVLFLQIRYFIQVSVQMSPQSECPSLKYHTPSSNHHSIFLPLFIFPLALSADTLLHVYFPLLGMSPPRI